MSLPPVVAIDNGGGNCKVGMAGQPTPTRVFPNASAKPKGERQTLIADLLADTKEVSQLQLKRPFDRGYLCNLELQREIWSRAVRTVLRRTPSECGLLLTEPLFNFDEIRADTQKVLQGGVRRINLGGKAMTNYLKELVSYRYVLSYVNAARSPHRREFVLPDGVHNLRGYLRDPKEWSAKVESIKQAVREAESLEEKKRLAAQLEADQVLVLNNERFMVPELLFHPDDIGLHQAGVAEAVVQAVTATHPALAPLLYSNVVLTGGVTSCPGFKERFTAELRALVPDDHQLNVFQPPDPALFAWEGMSMFGSSYLYNSVAVTKAQYEESGSWAAHRHYS
ncbi:actin-related protein Arp6 [Volvox carteri f. nagariensis]|uniref:Actin-related protein Arp6 n=1 Tax=Volvox carteri f. nagariensis TaxID=3068 RepID=D8U2Z9_VOLCA|nr:actin-related protein Arp6 [Volvox carteri f. nagariensis]EFJ45987.1 actin-related protein Arp6 [Volvox carteri f. nagariensis]|eukprot:XP_002953065.1 actin-related protein Arp6 [Volvox carteri f. nagariensis]